MFENHSNTEDIGQRRLALLLPAHNEELLIQHTIRSAERAGILLDDVYVVDDNSSDDTRSKVLELLPESNLLTVERSGKAGAISKAIAHFKIKERYQWLHVADADSFFGKEYFKRFISTLADLPDEYVVAIGYVQSMPGNWISKYRVYQYTYGQSVMRRLQAWLNMISVLPGPTTCFRTDILDKLDFFTESLTEDFDITLQIHRKRIGKMKFIPEAINFTQDPRTIADFRKQYLRWVRGFFQGVRRHRIGTGRQRIDAYLGIQLFETFLYIVQIFFVYPFIAYFARDGYWLMNLFLWDIGIFLTITLYAAITTNRPNIIYAFPLFYVLRTLELIWFIQAFVEVYILRKFTQRQTGWDTAGRRYAVNNEALQEVGL